MISLSLNRRHQIARQSIATIAIWGVAVGIGSYLGLFSKFPLPWFALLVAIGITAPVTLYYGNSRFRGYIQGLHLNYLTVFHLWRIPAALAWFYYGSQHLLPETFVRNAAWGDLVAGLLVVPVLVFPNSQWKYWVFHLFGMTDFIVAVGTGLTFALLQIPMMETVTTYPIALVPLFGVGISGASHIMALDLLARRQAKIF
ncbi:MAG: hypothetical protein KME17_04495 [Cyanosarcina radialis HA8281-LM2]|jgi:hypothetical protein|nr:hypothetical protein [Cyanosarcina radialis HA8281-LM2]